MGACLMMVCGIDLSMGKQVILLAVTTAIFGLPHSLVDIVVADWLQITAFQFLKLYATCMGLVLVAWTYLPRSTLTIFVLMSVYHFGEGDTKGSKGKTKVVDLLVRGGMILLPIRFHAADVSWIFSHLVGGASIEPVMSTLNLAGSMHLCLLGLSLLLHGRKCHRIEDLTIVVEIVTVALMFLVLPPLMSFVIYFNVFHSLRHLLSLRHLSAIRNVKSGNLWKRQYLVPFGFVLATVLALLAYLCLTMYQFMEEQLLELPQESTNKMLGYALRCVFIGLSAMTMPHMLVVGLLHLRFSGAQSAAGQSHQH